jgi:molybdopterin converting factor small subunit
MAIVRVRGPLKQLADGCAEHDLAGATVGDLLRALEEAHPALRGWVLDERGAIRRHVNVFVNGEQGAAQTSVGDGDRVEVLPAISGG